MTNGTNGANGTKKMSDGAAPAKKKPKGKLKLLLAVLLLAAALAAAAYYYFYVFQAQTAEKETPELPVQTVDMGNLTVNLADVSGARYLRVTLVVEIPQSEELVAEFTEREHRIRHSMLALLRQKTAADVRNPDSLEGIQSELLEEINRHLTTGEAKGLFFKEYLVQ